MCSHVRCAETRDQEAIQAARAAQLDDVVLGLKAGYETRVGERGGSLSGGQKQRVSIARALVRDAGILVLDEATSAVDTQTEAKLVRAITPMRKGKTTIVIAHRLATVQQVRSGTRTHNGASTCPFRDSFLRNGTSTFPFRDGFLRF